MGDRDRARSRTLWVVLSFGEITLGALLLWSGERLPVPLGSADRALLDLVRRPVLLAMVVLAALSLATLVLRAAAQSELPLAGSEALLPLPSLPSFRSAVPLLAVIGAAPGAGATTIAFNLAVALAALGEIGGEGERRHPRPICLLSEGTLATALDLSPKALEDYLQHEPYRLTAEIVNLARHHVSGCEVLCLGEGGRAAEQIRTLLILLREHYGAIIVDAGRSHRVAEVAAELGDGLLLVTPAGAAASRALEAWAEGRLAPGLEGKTALVLNQIEVRPAPELAAPFAGAAVLPREWEIPALDQSGVAWALDEQLAATRQLHEMARQLFRDLISPRRPSVA